MASRAWPATNPLALLPWPGATGRVSTAITNRLWFAVARLRPLLSGFPRPPDFTGACRHDPVVQGEGKNAERLMPIVHVLFSNVKTWLNGTYHGLSAKHLPRYAREWDYRL